jgi:hypothetical protein
MSLTWRRSRITGAGLVAAQYDLTLERQTTMDNILFIPGIANPVAEIRQLLFGQGQPGGSWIPTLSAAMIAANSFGSGVTDILDLSGNNNPFSQATSGNRAAWFREPKRGRVNLLVYTNDLSQTPWSKTAINTSVVAGVGPVGDQVATKLIPTTVSTQHFVSQQFTSTLVPHRSSIYLKADGYRWLRLAFGGGVVSFDSLNGVIGLTSGTPNALVTSLPNGWFRVSLTGTSGVNPQVVFVSVNESDSTSTQTFAGDGTSGVLVSGAQVEIGTIATGFQNVTTAFDVTESGQRDCYGVRADGIDDFYTTASIDFTGTDKVTVFAALRKFSDAATGVFAELTNSIALNNGAFVVAAPALSGTDKYRFESKGTTPASATTASAAFNAPITNVITGLGDIGSPFATLRVNGAVLSTITTTQGTGNYANDVLYLFRRGGTTLPFNGNLYALIVAGGSYPLSTIQRVERLLSRITPTVNL